MALSKNPNQPLVSIITVNYNHSDDTIEFLDSLVNSNYKNLEIIVIDNGSEPGDAEKIADKFKNHITLYSVEKNIGYAPANNIGIHKASGDYIMSLNNDMVVDKDFMFPLIEALESDENIGVVCPKIYFYDPPQNIQFAGYTEINPITIRNHAIGFNQPDTGQYDRDSISEFAHGGALMFKAKLLEDVGDMSEYFFLYYEDMDWCKRVRYAGYKICYVHKSKVYHKDAVTNVPNSPLKMYYQNRGRLIYMRRHVKLPMLFLSLLYVYLVALPKNVIFHSLKREFKQASSLVKAYTWFLIHMFDKEMKVDPEYVDRFELKKLD